MSRKSWIDQWHEFWDGPPVDVIPVEIPGEKEPHALIKLRTPKPAKAKRSNAERDRLQLLDIVKKARKKPKRKPAKKTKKAKRK